MGVVDKLLPGPGAMSQTCPSSSHQLVAATIAFRKARRKFPKDFGLRPVTEGILKTKLDTSSIPDKTKYQSSTGTLSPKNGSNPKSKQDWSMWTCNDTQENDSTKENSSTRSSGTKCSCCRHCYKGQCNRELLDLDKLRNSFRGEDILGRSCESPNNRFCMAKPFKKEGRSSCNKDRKETCRCKSKSPIRSLVNVNKCGIYHSCYHGRRRSFFHTQLKPRTADQLCRIHPHDNCRFSPRLCSTCGYSLDLDGSPQFSKRDLKRKQRKDVSLKQRNQSPDILILDTCDHKYSLDLLENHNGHQQQHLYHCEQNSKQRYSTAKTSLSPKENCIRPSLVKARERKLKVERNSRMICQEYLLRRCSPEPGLREPLSKEKWSNESVETTEELPLIRHKDSVPILMERFQINDKRKDIDSGNNLDGAINSKRSDDTINHSVFVEVSEKDNVNLGYTDLTTVDIGYKRIGCQSDANNNYVKLKHNTRSRLARSGFTYTPKHTLHTHSSIPWRYMF